MPSEVVASSALGAAEVVAALRGHPSPYLPERVAVWVGGRRQPGKSVVKKAHDAAWKVWETSVCRTRWEEGGDLDTWEEEIDDLLARLAKRPRKSKARVSGQVEGDKDASLGLTLAEVSRQLNNLGVGEGVGSLDPAPIGAVYAFPMPDGYFGACRVIRKATPSEQEDFDSPAVLVVGTTWAKKRLPCLERDRRALRQVLALTYPNDLYNRGGCPEAYVLPGSPPRSFVFLGRMRSTKHERGLDGPDRGTWRVWEGQPLVQQEWLERRAAYMENWQPLAMPRGRSVAARLRALRRKNLFAALRKERVSGPGVYESADEYVKAAIDDLLTLSDEPELEDVLATLEWTVERFNELVKWSLRSSAVEQLELVAICDAFRILAAACGYPQRGDFTRKWRVVNRRDGWTRPVKWPVDA